MIRLFLFYCPENKYVVRYYTKYLKMHCITMLCETGACPDNIPKITILLTQLYELYIM